MEGNKTKADVISHILNKSAEYYLDANDDSNKKSIKKSFDYISKEAAYYRHFNEDIEKIVLFDNNGRIYFSTYINDYKSKQPFPYVDNAIKKPQEEPLLFNFKDSVKYRGEKNDDITGYDNYISRILNLFSKNDDEENIKVSFTSITYSIYLNKYKIDELLKDFNDNYKLYYESISKDQKDIYIKIYDKYRKHLDKKGIVMQSGNRRSKYSKYAGDIDFLFHELFSNIINKRGHRITKDERWLYSNNWLLSEKNNSDMASRQNNPEKVKEINGRISERMQSIARKADEIRYLGAMAVVFNNDKIEYELDKTINRVILLAIVMIGVTLLAFYFVFTFMIRNLKKLEKWAEAVSGGNLDTRIVINTNDQIGRLGDIFNNMIDQMTIKFQLEKFLSNSAISMIGKKSKSDSAAEISLGHTERRNLVFLFSDVRGFTSFSEKNDPSIVMEVLNNYLELQSDIIIANNGDIDNFVGDEIIALFRKENRIERAIDTAIQIMQKIEKENERRKKEKLAWFEVGIGIHCGDVVVGNIGTKKRIHFTSIGDAMNLASRLCSNANANEILVSKETFSASSKKYQAINVAPITVKNKEKPIPIVKIKV